MSNTFVQGELKFSVGIALPPSYGPATNTHACV